MKKLITLSFCLFVASLSAQTTTSDDYYNPEKPKLLAKDRVSASISAGTGMFFSGKNTGYTTFIAPKIGYQVTNKFKLNIGMMHYTMTGNTFMRLDQNSALINSGNRSTSGNLLFAEGQYQVGKKLVVSGAVMYDANNFSNKNNNVKAASLGLDYKVTKHSTISVKATVSQGTSPYNYNSGFGNTTPANGFGGFGQDFMFNQNNPIR